MSPDGASVLVRSLGFVLLFQAAGAAFLSALASGLLDRSERAIRKVQLGAALCAVALVALHLALEPARLAGGFPGMFDRALLSLVLSTSGVAANALQVVGLLFIAIGSMRTSAGHRLLSRVGAVVTLSGFLLTGHTTAHELRPVLAPLLLIHLLIVAFWIGSMVPMLLVLRLESAAIALSVLRRFSAWAVWLVPLVAVAGVLLLIAIAHGLPDLRMPYGELILAKALGFVLLIGIATANKVRLMPALAKGSAMARRHLQITIVTEFVLICGVLATTAIMTTFYSP